MALVMVGAVATLHWDVGLFMDWNGTGAGQGFEYHLLALGLAAIVVVAGSSSPFSVDAWIASRLQDRSERQVPQRAAA